MAYEMSFIFLGISMLLHISSSFAGAIIVKPRFNYSDPTKWTKISPEFAHCSTGKSQSPVNIIPGNTKVNEALGPLETYYHVNNASLLCNGLSVQVAVDAKSELVIDGKAYRLYQMHWHTPSEHRINGIQFPAELHQVHRAEDGSVAVIAILYEYGKPDPIVSMIRPYLTEMNKKHGGGYDGVNPIPIVRFPSMLIKERPRTYYRYSGSFTTPPCTEQVTWTIISKARTISRKQVQDLDDLLDAVNRKNARPVQPLNGRTIQRYE